MRFRVRFSVRSLLDDPVMATSEHLHDHDLIRLTYSVSEAAVVLGISRGKAYDCVRTGELPSVRFGRRIVIPAAVVRRLLNGDDPRRTGE